MQNNKSSKKKSEKVIYRNGIPESVQSRLPDKQMKQYYISKLSGIKVECLHGKMKNKEKATQTGGFFVSVVDHQGNAVRCFRSEAEEKGSHTRKAHILRREEM